MSLTQLIRRILPWPEPPPPVMEDPPRVRLANARLSRAHRHLLETVAEVIEDRDIITRKPDAEG